MAIGMMVLLRNARLDAITTYIGASGKLRLYSGTQPATGGAITTLLAEMICNATFAPGAAAGVLTLNAIAVCAAAAATGTATWGRFFKSDGTTIVMDCTVGTGGTDIVLNTAAIVINAQVSVTSATISEANP